LQESDRFEDILMGANRPTLVVQRYQEIYSQERVEAYDALTDIEGLSEEVFIPSLLLDILKFAYSAAQCYLESLHNGWKRALNIKDSSLTEPQGGNAIKQLQSAVSIYIRKSSSSFNHKDIMEVWDACFIKACFINMLIVSSDNNYVNGCNTRLTIIGMQIKKKCRSTLH
jgi:hypothetical protein